MYKKAITNMFLNSFVQYKYLDDQKIIKIFYSLNVEYFFTDIFNKPPDLVYLLKSSIIRSNFQKCQINIYTNENIITF